MYLQRSRFSGSPYRAMGARGLGDSDDIGEPPTFGKKLSTGVASGALIGLTAGMQSGPLAGAIAGGLAVIAPFTGPAAPFLLAAAALVGPIAQQFGCGKTCVQASKFADEAAAKAKQLSDMYWGQPVRYATSQAQALAYLNQLADWLRAACSDPSLGNAGQRCISERLIRGGPAPWCPSADHTGCDYYTSIIDPIANDTGVVPDPPSSALDSVGATIQSFFTGSSGSLPGWVVPAVVLAVGLYMVEES